MPNREFPPGRRAQEGTLGTGTHGRPVLTKLRLRHNHKFRKMEQQAAPPPRDIRRKWDQGIAKLLKETN